MSADGSYAFPATPSPEELARFPLNDLGNAFRLIRTVGGQIGGDGAVETRHARLLYLRQRGWIAFDGRCWDLASGEERARRFAHQVAGGLIAQSGHAPITGKGWMDFVNKTGNAGGSSAMLAQAQAYLAVDLDAFDAEPMALNVRNGVLTFAAGKDGAPKLTFRGVHDPADRFTRLADADWDPAAGAPRFEALLAFAQPRAEMRAYLAKVFGYSATGSTKEQAFFVLQGKGRDGKSTLVNAVRGTLGTFAATAAVETFLDTGMTRAGDASPHIARLAGDTRLACTAEPPSGSKLAGGAVKVFTGGGRLAARELRQGIFEFEPRCKVVMECNRRPTISDVDDGIWRRIRIVLFERQVPVEDVDPDLPERLKAERSGILNWLAGGVLAWMAEGLGTPAGVAEAIEDYRRGANPFGDWLNERLDRSDPSARIGSKELYADYKAWCEDNGIEKPMSTTMFGRALGDQQVIRAGKDSKGNVVRRGAKLRPTGYGRAEEPDPFAPPSGLGGAGGRGVAEDFGPPPGDDEMGEGGA